TVISTTAFNDKNVRGTWRLEVWNNNNGATGGKLLGWSLAILGPRLPQIGALTVSPNPVTQESNLTLTATNVPDRYPGGTITSVSFYRDANGNGILDANDLLVGTNTNGNNGWSVTTSTAGLAPGTYTYFAVAQDNFGVLSLSAAVTVTVQKKKGK